MNQTLLDYTIVTDASGGVTMLLLHNGIVAFTLPIEIPGDTERRS